MLSFRPNNVLELKGFTDVTSLLRAEGGDTESEPTVDTGESTDENFEELSNFAVPTSRWLHVIIAVLLYHDQILWKLSCGQMHAHNYHEVGCACVTNMPSGSYLENPGQKAETQEKP